MCDLLEVIGSPSTFIIIRSVSALTRIESARLIALDEVLKLQGNGQFPDDPVKIEDTQIHCVDTQTY